MKLFTFALMLCFSPLSSGQSTKEPQPKNLSGLVVTDTGDPSGVQNCKGKLSPKVKLNSGIGDSDLASGAMCFARDFEGHGLLDFVLYVDSKVEVIFFNADGSGQTQILKIKLYPFYFDMNSQYREYYPSHKNDQMLVSFRDADNRGGQAFYFNKKTRKFEEIPYVHPKNYHEPEI